MDEQFWQQKWDKNEIAFHETQTNPLLIKYFKTLSLAKGNRVFVPLCGKTRDIAWLLSNGFRVAGVELIETAIEQLFEELGVEPAISGVGEIKRYTANNIDIFVGDIFAVSGDMLGTVDAVYDRAALVALPETMRYQYSQQLVAMTEKAPQLLITYEYDQDSMNGPPFSVPNSEVNQHYREQYHLTLAASASVPGGLKGKCPAIENVWLLQND